MLSSVDCSLPMGKVGAGSGGGSGSPCFVTVIFFLCPPVAHPDFLLYRLGHLTHTSSYHPSIQTSKVLTRRIGYCSRKSGSRMNVVSPVSARITRQKDSRWESYQIPMLIGHGIPFSFFDHRPIGTPDPARSAPPPRLFDPAYQSLIYYHVVILCWGRHKYFVNHSTIESLTLLQYHPTNPRSRINKNRTLSAAQQDAHGQC